MARRLRARTPDLSQNRYYVTSETRDPSVIANARPAPGPALTFPVLISPRSVRPLIWIEDRRTWNPSPYRAAAMVSRPRHRLRIHSPLNAGAKRRAAAAPLRPDLMRRGGAVPSQVAFRGAPSVLVCIRRGMRREVLFAKKRAGRAPKRRPRWSVYSKIVCGRR